MGVTNTEICANTFTEDIANQPAYLEDVWQQSYDDRRGQWKKKNSLQPTVTE